MNSKWRNMIVSLAAGQIGILKKTRIILLLTRITSFHVYVLERYDICMVRRDAQREKHVTGSALSWRIVLSRCDVITIMLWQSFTVEVVLKVILVDTPAIRHIHVNMSWSNRNLLFIQYLRGELKNLVLERAILTLRLSEGVNLTTHHDIIPTLKI